jgi:hypothetical protein
MSPTNARADDQRLRAFRQAFADRVELPMSASVLDEPVTVVEIAYDGNRRRGLTARCRTGRGREHVIALADVCFPEGGEAARLVGQVSRLARPGHRSRRSDVHVACVGNARGCRR